MLSPSVVEEVRRLLAAGQWSMRKIARELAVSRGTVSAIAHGKRQEPLPRASDDDLLFASIGPLQRCPGCGGLVYLPCLLCRVRQWQAACCGRTRANRPAGILELELVGEHRARYERVRARKLRLIARGEDGG
jgi:hypothetical protein